MPVTLPVVSPSDIITAMPSTAATIAPRVRLSIRSPSSSHAPAAAMSGADARVNTTFATVVWRTASTKQVPAAAWQSAPTTAR